jgi:diguanylate cyclase (GGDEF)-like protein
MYLNFKSANEFIQNQLYTTAEDTATSLGLSLSLNIPEGDDLSTMETMINAIFDRGYYESIILKDTNNKILIENKNILKVKDIPDWFITHVHIVVPTAQTQISSGWMPYGVLSIKLHTGHAYVQLWNIFIDILQTFTFLVALVLLVLYILLKFVLKSLKGVEKQAIAISKNDFIIQKELPFTTEFKSVVKAMNKMVVKVKDIFEHEAQMVQKYNNILYNDQDTGMGNRKFFSLRLSSFLSQEDAKSSGTVIIFVLNNFNQTKKVVGYEVLNTYINNLAEVFYESTKGVEERVVSRLKDSEFAMILPQTSYKKTQRIITRFLQKCEQIKQPELKDVKEFYISGGATYFDENDNQKDILSRADFALSTALMQSEPYVHYHEIRSDETLEELGKQEWYKFITNAIKNNTIKLATQPVKEIDGWVFHQETYLRMSDKDGKLYPARVFVPMVHSLELSDDVDKKVIELSIKLAKENTQNEIAINISSSFIMNTQNDYWLENIFKNLLHVKPKLSFEASNYAILHNLDGFINFARLVQKYGYGFGIDNFTITSRNLLYLQDLKPRYIKANKSFYLDMNAENNNSFHSFKILASSLDIKLIATAVETYEESKALQAIPITLQQGTFIEVPKM